MGHHGSHLEFCKQSENCFWVSKIFLIKYMTKKEHFKKKFWGALWGGVAFITPKMMDFWNEQKICLKSVHMWKKVCIKIFVLK